MMKTFMAYFDAAVGLFCMAMAAVLLFYDDWQKATYFAVLYLWLK